MYEESGKHSRASFFYSPRIYYYDNALLFSEGAARNITGYVLTVDSYLYKRENRRIK